MRQITYLPDGYQFDVPEAALSMQFRNIQQTSKELWAEIEIYQTLAGERVNHHWSGLNLLAPTTKASLAKEMARKVESYEHWGELIESLCYQAAQEFRKPQASEQIGLHEPPVKVWRLWPFIANNEPSIIFGDPEAGKTYYALLQAICIQSGRPLLDLRPLQGNVLYIDYEADRDTIERRLRRICRGLDIPYVSLEYYAPGGTPLIQAATSIQAIIKNKNIVHTFTDSALLAVGGSLENAEMVGKTFGVYRSFGTSNTILAHVAKNALSNKRTPFGSTFWTAMARSVWEVLGDRGEEGGNILEQGIRHVKGNEIGRQVRRGYEWQFTIDEEGPEQNNSIVVQQKAIKEMTGLAALQTSAAKVWKAIDRLESAKGTIKEIAEAAEMTKGAVKMAISRNKKLFVSLENQPGKAAVYGILSPNP